MEQVFFFYFAFVIAAASVLVVALRNPIYSALALLIMFFHVAGLYVTLHAEFLAAVQIIVYAGAILVLYLFVVMLLNLKQDDRYHRQWPMAAAVGVTLLIEAIILTAMKGWTAPVVATGTETTVGETGQYRSDRRRALLHLFVSLRGGVLDSARGDDRRDHAGQERHRRICERSLFSDDRN